MDLTLPDAGKRNEVQCLGRVLLVDDEPELRRLLRRFLARAGYEVVEAVNGSAGLLLARRERFDVVITDVRMPLMSGLELLEYLVVEEPGLPVVLISGSTELQNRRSAIAMGAFDFLAKPISLAHLQSVASSAVAQRGYSDADEKARQSHDRLKSAAVAALPINWK